MSRKQGFVDQRLFIVATWLIRSLVGIRQQDIWCLFLNQPSGIKTIEVGCWNVCLKSDISHKILSAADTTDASPVEKHCVHGFWLVISISVWSKGLERE